MVYCALHYTTYSLATESRLQCCGESALSPRTGEYHTSGTALVTYKYRVTYKFRAT